VTLAIGVILGAAALNLVGGNGSFVRADDRDQRMDQSKWTTGDRARDALDHLKKAEVEMNKVASDENSKVANDASKLCTDARAKVDEFVSELDAKKKH
jgi:hypothetical protein